MRNIKLLSLFLLFTFPLLVSAQTWSDPTGTPPSNNAAAPINVSASDQTKAGSLILGNGLGITAGNLIVSTGYASSSQFCLAGICITNWPTGGSGSSVILSNIRSFASSGTWTKPANLAYIVVEVWGGGGGGGGGASGGGGGAYCEKLLRASDLSLSVAFTVGAGGAGGNPWSSVGQSGSASSFGPCNAGGGSANQNLNNRMGSAGGTASGGDLNINGGDGGGNTGQVALAGNGGNSPRGGAGGEQQGWYGTPAGSGKVPGGGGSGGGTQPNGNGANGMVVVYEYTYAGSGGSQTYSSTQTGTNGCVIGGRLSDNTWSNPASASLGSTMNGSQWGIGPSGNSGDNLMCPDKYYMKGVHATYNCSGGMCGFDIICCPF